MTLRLKVVQWDDEPMWSLLQRLSAQLGTGTVRSLCRDLGLDFYRLKTARGMREFAKLAGYEAERIIAASASLDGDSAVSIGSQRFAVMDFHRERVRLCPHCLRQDIDSGRGAEEYRAHWRAWWTLTDFLCCPIHGVRLIDRHPESRIPLDRTVSDPRFAAGPGTDLSLAEPESAGDTSFERYVLGRLGFVQPVGSDILDRIDLNYAMRLIFRVGFAAVHGQDSTPDEAMSDPARSAVSASGMSFLVGDASPLAELFDTWVLHADPAKGNWGQRVVYGKLYDWLNQERKWSHTAYAPMRDFIRRHAIESFPVNPKEEFFGVKPERRWVYTLYHAAEEVDRHQSMLRPILIKLGILTEEQTKLDDWRIFINADQVEELKAFLSGIMNAKQAMEYLGIPRGTFVRLVNEDKVLAPFMTTGGLEQGETLYRKSDLDAWIDNMAGEAPWIDEQPVTASSMLSAKRDFVTTTANLIVMLQKGEIKALGRVRNEKPFKSIVLDIETVKEAIFPKDAVDLTFSEAIAELKTTAYVFEILVGKCYIDRREIEGTIRSRAPIRYCAQQIAYFKDEYISAKEAAAWLGTHSRVLAKKLEPFGISHAIQIEVGAASDFYLRKQIHAIEKDSLRTPRFGKNERERLAKVAARQVA